jgi:phenylacetate-coenzyme A ligase PaaK-like adenylate-forming protein
MVKDADPFWSLNPAFPKQLPTIALRTMSNYRQLRQFERVPPARQDALLAGQLNHLLAHAKRNAPFWAERLARWRVGRPTPQEILDGLPPLNRTDIQRHKDRMAAQYPERAALGVATNTTSGSTGTPVTVQLPRGLFAPLYHAVTMVSAAWHGMDQKKMLGVLGAKVKDAETAPLGTPFSWFGPVGQGFRLCTTDRDIPEIYNYLVRKNAPYLQMGPNTAVRLARYARDEGRRDLQVDQILTLGSAVTPDVRELVRTYLGAKMIDRYSCEETGYIALQCPKYPHHHLISPVTWLEIVDEEGRPCPTGTPGRILLTSPHSYTMPLIRYDVGDRGEWGEPCDCGIQLPVIKTILGRTRDLIITPDGRQTYARIHGRDFEDLVALKEYRFVLHRNAVIVAQLIVSEHTPALTAAVTDRVQRAIGYPYPVRVHYVDRIDWGSSWKQENFAVSNDPAPEAEMVAG